MLKQHGGQQVREEMPENLAFENTVQVVEIGLYRYVRHPMYSSLLFLGWGAFLKHITLLNAGLVIWITGFIVAAARVEEKENIRFFGSKYAGYIRRTKMFIPWLF
jgi:protein-S-isoprenylcysteine O-methyltransferase Ste14